MRESRCFRRSFGRCPRRKLCCCSRIVGALFHLEETVAVGQTVILVNDHTAQSIECRVVSIHRARDSKQYVGVEFLSAEANFWHMQFPSPGAKPMRRVLPDKASA